MKKNLHLMTIVILLAMTVQSYAQTPLLTFGQTSKQSWTATSFFALNTAAGPRADWFTSGFDDSSWTTIQGPISTSNLPYVATAWSAYNATYWVRRHFTIADLNDYICYYFYAVHDNDCEVYLNGSLIYQNSSVVSYPNFTTLELTEEMKNNLKQGDNVLAVRVRDVGPDGAYMDFGLDAFKAWPLKNPYFNNNTVWTGAYDRHNRDGNTIGYRYGQTLECKQDIVHNPGGLYLLSANACGLEYYNDQNQAKAHQNDAVPAKLFINGDEMSIPSAFTERAPADYAYYWNMGDGYVPYYVDGLPKAFDTDMYQCELWSFYVPDSSDSMTVGIHSNAPDNISRWAAWDNMKLTYYDESEVAVMLDSIVVVMTELSKKAQKEDIRNQTLSLIDIAKAADDYTKKAQAYIAIERYEPVMRRSIDAYEHLVSRLQVLKDGLGKTTEFTSPATISEATALRDEVQNAYDNGLFTNEQVSDAVDRLNHMIVRLTYKYIEIVMNVPGYMGDSILSRVENFVDVQGLKISGTLNAADFSTIQTRLSSLREIDLSGVNTTSLPDNLFYQHYILEIVKLPVILTSIGDYAFYQCYELKNIDLPATLQTIENSAFRECDSLQQVILPEGVSTLASCAFYSCDNNISVKLPSSLKVIGDNVFAYNYKLKKVEFAEGLTNIENYAFYECYALDSLYFPNSLTYIGYGVFNYDDAIKVVEFNEGLYQIRDNAFYDCDGLTEIVLPSTLVLAYESPFDYCDNLRKVTCLAIEPPYMADQMPYGVDMAGRELYVPALSINVYKQAVGWDRFPTIKPIDYLPENIFVRSDLRLTLPTTIPAEYKPNVKLLHATDTQYGSLTVNGEGTLSMSGFHLFWDPNLQYSYSNRNLNYGSLINNSHLRADAVSLETYNRNDRWTFISFPFDVKLSEIVPINDGTTNFAIRKYDGQKRASGATGETWVKLSGDDVLKAGEGYIMQSSRYIGTSWQDYSGFLIKAINNENKNNLFRTTDLNVTLSEYASEFAHNRSWNLIGNPYPSYYDTRFMDFSAPITVWNMNNNTYVAYSPIDDSYILCPGEAFFVQCPVDNANIIFGKGGRQTDRAVRAMAAPKRVGSAEAVSQRKVVNLTISDGSNIDRTRVVLNDNAAMLYEMDKDAGKFISDDASIPQLFSTYEGVDYAINERPFADGIVNLSTRINVDGVYTIALKSSVNGYDVVLEDKVLKKSIVLTEDSEYTFSAKAGEDVNRFAIVFRGNITGIDSINPELNNNSTIYKIDGIKVTQPTQEGIYIQDGQKVLINK